MKKILSILIIYFTGAGFIFGQEIYKFRVLLTDKNENEYSVDRPEQFLSGKAIERRQKYGIPVDESDLPVSAKYVNELKATGMAVIHTSKWLNSVLIATSDSAAAINLKDLPFVDSVKVVWKKKQTAAILSDPAINSGIQSLQNATSVTFLNEDEYYGKAATQIKMHNGHLLHNAGYRGAGITIAIIDAGFRNANTIEGLKGSIIGEKDFVVPNGDVYINTGSDHGTKVFSTMGANLPNIMVGTAPEASYWLLRSEDTSSEYPVEEDNWAAAAEYADSIGVDVINSSLGYTKFDYPAESYTTAQMDGKTAFISQAADMAGKKGILVCSSAGNSGNDIWRHLNYPGDAEHILTMGSVNKDSIIASSSSVGPTTDGRIKPDVAAMGVSACILDATGDVVFSSGTSYASPVMAGLAACLRQAFPDHDNIQIMDMLTKNASKSDMPDYDYGYGIPDVYKAYISNTSGVKVVHDGVGKHVIFLSTDGNLCIRNLFPMNDKYTLTIYNSVGGSPIKKMHVSENETIDISSFQKGIYLVSVQGKQDIYTCKIIK